jgi:hypothetical protein
MNHFPTGGWFDFALGVLPPVQAVAMQDHLNGGCDQCFKALQLWQTVLKTAHRERAYHPPPAAVRTVKAVYSSQNQWRWLPQIARIARPVFDSFRHPSAAAIRSTMPSSRQFLHEAEPFVIDLRVEREPAQKRVWLMGQVLNSNKSNKRIDPVDIVLLSGERLVAKTAANLSGEFELEFGDEKGLQLFINIRGQRAIGILLPDQEI